MSSYRKNHTIMAFFTAATLACFLHLFSGNAFGAADTYIPGQLIIKLKDGRSIADIQQLNDNYNVRSPRKVFSDTPAPEDVLRGLKDEYAHLGPSHDSWYWQLDTDSKESKEYATRIEDKKADLQKRIKGQEDLIALLAERQERAPRDTVPPAVDSIYVLQAEDNADIPAIAAAYQRDPAVEYAHPNYRTMLLSGPLSPNPPNDPLYYIGGNNTVNPVYGQWAHKNTNIETAWAITKGDPSVIIAVIDSGIDYTHEDLKGNLWINPNPTFGDTLGARFYLRTDASGALVKDANGNYILDKDGSIYDNGGHGTMCAGIAASRGNNAMGVIGACPECRIMPVKGDGSLGTVQAIQYAVAHGASVISMSWVGGDDPTIKAALTAAYNAGVVLVAGVGNSNAPVKNYPAAYDNVIAVGATDITDARWVDPSPGSITGSTYGEWLDVVAPGVQCTTTRPFYNLITGRALTAADKYTNFSMTSSSTPYVAGLAGLIIAKNKSSRIAMTSKQISDIIRFTSDHLGGAGKDDYYGWGRINAGNALRMTSIPLPTLPENLTATAASSSLVNLKWNAKYAERFDVERSTDNFNFTRLPAKGTNASYADTTALPNTTYYYRVRSVNSVGYSAFCAGKSVRTPLPEAPSSLTATAQTYTQIKLAWTNTAVNITGFAIERSTDNFLTYISFPVSKAASSYTDTSATANTTYSYRIRAVSAAGNSSPSNIAQATTSTPKAPTNFIAYAISTTQIQLIWKDNSDNELGFKIQRATSKYGPFTEFSPRAANSTSALNGNLSPGITYYYRLCSFNSVGNSIFAEAQDMTFPVPPLAVQLSEVMPISATQLRITWQDTTTNIKDGVKIERRTATTSFAEINKTIGRIGTYTDPNLITGTRYYYRVRAYNSAGDSPYSQVLSAVANDPLKDTTVPTVPAVRDEGVSTTNKDHLIVYFSAADAESGIADFQYRLTQDSISGPVVVDWTAFTPFSTKVQLGGTVIRYGLTLTAGKKYYFAVKAKNGVGLWSAAGYSDGITIK